MKPALPIAIAAVPIIALGVYFYFQNVAFNERNAAKEQALTANRLPPIEPAPIPLEALSDPTQSAEFQKMMADIRERRKNLEAEPTSSATQLAAPAPVGDQNSQDEKLYDAEINLNLKMAVINNIHFKAISNDLEEAAGLSSAERAKSPVIADALATSKAGRRFADLAGCLNDQKKRGVGYYQGKATCAAWFPDS